jgi:hypothetical protein
MSVSQESSIAGIQVIQRAISPTAAKVLEITCLAGVLPELRSHYWVAAVSISRGAGDEKCNEL